MQVLTDNSQWTDGLMDDHKTLHLSLPVVGSEAQKFSMSVKQILSYQDFLQEITSLNC